MSLVFDPHQNVPLKWRKQESLSLEKSEFSNATQGQSAFHASSFIETIVNQQARKQT